MRANTQGFGLFFIWAQTINFQENESLIGSPYEGIYRAIGRSATDFIMGLAIGPGNR